MNVTKNKYVVNNERGIMLNEVDFSRFVELYGNIIQVSNDGRNFLFQKPDKPFEVHVICLTRENLLFMKTINFVSAIDEYI